MPQVTLVPPEDSTPKPVTLIPPIVASTAPTTPKPVTLVPPPVKTEASIAAAPAPAAPATKPGTWSDMGATITRRGKEALGDLKTDLAAPPTLRDAAASVIPGVGPLTSKPAQDVFNYVTAPVAGAVESGVKPLLKAAEPYTAPIAAALNHFSAIFPKPVKAEDASKKLGDLAGSAAIPAGGESRAAKMGGELAEAGGAAMKPAIDAIKSVFAPTSRSAAAGETERVIRGARGAGDLATERAAHDLLRDNKVVANLPVQQQRGLVDYIENRSSGARIPDPRLQKTADRVADVADKTRARAEATLRPEDLPAWRQDYYAHMWKEKPDEVQARMQMYAKQGSGRSFKQRTIPTISDGLKAGLTPKFENPIENTIRYVTSINRYIGTHDIINQLEDLGHVGWFKGGDQPEGWVPLNGIHTEKAVPITAKEGEEPGASIIKRYAPPEVAMVYNNHISKGLDATVAAPFYNFVRHASNTMTMAKLGLSAFHLTTMATEGIISDVARGFQALSRGDVKTGLKAIAGAPAAPITTAVRGARTGNELLGKSAAPTPIDEKINDLFVKSGGRLRMDRLYNSSGSGSFFSAIQHGTFVNELKDAGTRIFGMGQGGPVKRAGAVLDTAARLVQTVSAPLFEKYIPAMKRGAFASRMGDWLKANPGATNDEATRYATQLQDSIDNRFGELVQDNLFWNKTFKQMSQLLLLSSTWDIGTVREIGGGIADLAKSADGVVKGKGISDRTAYVAALAATTAVINGAYTYLKTGTMPQGKDFMAARTGGTVPHSTQPERAMTPGYQKDVYAFGYNFPHNIGDEIVNKMNPGMAAAIDYARNQDYRGLPIYPGQGAKPQPGDPTMADDMIERFMPISVDNFKTGLKKGSNIGVVERGLGVRPAPMYMQDPQRLEQITARKNQKAWTARERADKRQKENIQQ